MTRKVICIVLVSLFVLGLFSHVDTAFAHTGYPPIPIYTFQRHPDFPIEQYVRGQMGIVLPSYDARFLYAAYRNITGAKFTEAEVRVMRQGWEPLVNARIKGTVAFERGERSWEENWFRLRASFEKDPDSAAYFRNRPNSGNYLEKDGQYTFFENCSDDAFRTAVATYEAREKAFSENKAARQSWLQAQDKVFENCKSMMLQNRVALPSPASASAPLVIQKDREYQIAAAYFYAGQFDEAKKRFEAVAKDSQSPWQDIAPYLVGRSLLRKAQLTAPEGARFEEVGMKAAEVKLTELVADKSRSKWHEPAQNLLEYIHIRINPSQTCSDLSRQLTKTGSLVGAKQRLEDYLYLLDESRDDSSLPERVCPQSDDLTDWIRTFNVAGPSEFHYSYEKWKKTRSKQWLLVALASAPPEKTNLDELLAACKDIPRELPVYWTAQFYRERLLVLKQKFDVARIELDKLLDEASANSDSNQSSRNLLLGLRARAAESLDDFLRFAVRTPVELVYLDEYSTRLTKDDKDPRDTYMRQEYAKPSFDDDAGAVINNHLPLFRLAAVAENSHLPLELKRNVALMAFTRAIVTDNAAMANRIAEILVPLAPELASELEAFRHAANRREKEFAAVWLILHHPEMQPALETGTTRATPPMQIDSFQDNWWAHFRFEDVTDDDADYMFYLRWWNRLPDHLKPVFPEGKIPEPAFVAKEDLATARAEWNKLEHLELAGDWLASRTLKFAVAQPQDPRVPEALHLAVRATRFGGTDSRVPNYSKQAFQYLHKHFPSNEWTKKTPYWY